MDNLNIKKILQSYCSEDDRGNLTLYPEQFDAVINEITKPQRIKKPLRIKIINFIEEVNELPEDFDFEALKLRAKDLRSEIIFHNAIKDPEIREALESGICKCKIMPPGYVKDGTVFCSICKKKQGSEDLAKETQKTEWVNLKNEIAKELRIQELAKWLSRKLKQIFNL